MEDPHKVATTAYCLKEYMEKMCMYSKLEQKTGRMVFETTTKEVQPQRRKQDLVSRHNILEILQWRTDYTVCEKCEDLLPQSPLFIGASWRLTGHTRLITSSHDFDNHICLVLQIPCVKMSVVEHSQVLLLIY